MALANRLVGNPSGAACLEISYGPAAFRLGTEVQIGITGAPAPVSVNGEARPMHQTLTLAAGDVLEIGAATAGARMYLALGGVLHADEFLGSASTYLPAGLGGHEGRALRKGDEICFDAVPRVPYVSTPTNMQPHVSSSYALRAVRGPDWSASAESPADAACQVSPRTSRMGVEIEGAFPALDGAGQKPSSAVFPGALQVTPQGRGFLLLADGQTTGGYPHLLQVIRADRHLLGQLRPGDSLRFLLRTQAEAETALRAKQTLLEAWLPDFRL